jgi:hypothetical protein
MAPVMAHDVSSLNHPSVVPTAPRNIAIEVAAPAAVEHRIEAIGRRPALRTTRIEGDGQVSGVGRAVVQKVLAEGILEAGGCRCMEVDRGDLHAVRVGILAGRGR